MGFHTAFFGVSENRKFHGITLLLLSDFSAIQIKRQFSQAI